MQVETVIQLVKNMPLDPIAPIEVVFREQVKVRKPTQNSLLWAGALSDIASQAWVNGRQFSAEVWHEYFKS
ncbi:recombination protein NinB, partial [Lactococcus petauri]|uniref:recombination protein NinB n=1 Tax=Lactococcus petauri TaxID=1940789 RepID=UPI0021F1E84F